MFKLTPEVVRTLVSEIVEKRDSSIDRENMPPLSKLLKSIVANKGNARSVADDIFGPELIRKFVDDGKSKGVTSARTLYNKVNDCVKFHKSNTPKVWAETFADVRKMDDVNIKLCGQEISKDEFLKFIDLAESAPVQFTSSLWKNMTEGISLKAPAKPADPEAHELQKDFLGAVVTIS